MRLSSVVQATVTQTLGCFFLDMGVANDTPSHTPNMTTRTGVIGHHFFFRLKNI